MSMFDIAHQLSQLHPELLPGCYPDAKSYWHARTNTNVTPFLHYDYRPIDHPDPVESRALYIASRDWLLLTQQPATPQQTTEMPYYKLAGGKRRHAEIACKIDDELNGRYGDLSPMTIFSPYDGSQDYRAHAYIRCGMSYAQGVTGHIVARTSEVVCIYQKYQEYFVGLTIELKETYARCFIEWKP